MFDRIVQFIVLFACAVCLIAPAQAQKRVALLLGNAAYQTESALKNPVNDVRLIERVLKQELNFDQVVVVPNGSRVQMIRELAKFKQLAQGSRTAIIYYSGHGMMNSRRQNFMLPVDMPKIAENASTDPDVELKSYAISEDELIDAVDGADIQLVVLDACRDNAFAPGRKSGTKGLARRADQGRSRLVAYATEEGRVAEDGAGGNSNYATSLASNLGRKQWPILRIFDEVATDVERRTNKRQIPTRSGNLRTDVYLLEQSTSTPVAPISPTGIDADNEAYRAAAAADSVEAYEQYLRYFPNGKQVGAANIRLVTIRKRDNREADTRSALSPTTGGLEEHAAGALIKDCEFCPDMVVLPTGTFEYGDPAKNASTKVTISDKMAMSKYETTVGQFRTFVAATGRKISSGCAAWVREPEKDPRSVFHDNRSWQDPGFPQSESQPVVCVDKTDAVAYADWLSTKTGFTYRLPSEVEWEWAAAGGTSGEFYYEGKANGRAFLAGLTLGLSWVAGASPTQVECEQENFGSGGDSDPCNGTFSFTAAGDKVKPNPFGLHHMLGNVSEWTVDCFEKAGVPPYSATTATAALVCADAKYAVRGASWTDYGGRYARGWGMEASRTNDLGFRVVRDLPAKK